MLISIHGLLQGVVLHLWRLGMGLPTYYHKEIMNYHKTQNLKLDRFLGTKQKEQVVDCTEMWCKGEVYIQFIQLRIRASGELL
jgi:hypothetical protein